MPANQNVTQLTQQTVSAAASSLFYAVTGGTTDTGLPLSVLVNNLGLTGTPTVPTATAGTNSTQIASTAFVATSFAPLASPIFTGTPTLPTGTIAVTQTAGNSSTAVATTAFVATSFAPLASPALTGTPTAPTAATGTSTTQIATTAFVANTFAAPPALGATTPNAATVTTLAATGLISPTSTIGIKGTATNDNPAAGNVGEYITATGTAISLTTGTAANITSISLTAGDWDVWGNVVFNPAGTTTTTLTTASVSTTSATSSASPFFTTNVNANNFGAGSAPTTIAPMQRILISATTTVFLVAQANFAVSTETATGYIAARRRR